MKKVKYLIFLFYLILLPTVSVQADGKESSHLDFLNGIQHNVYQKTPSSSDVSMGGSADASVNLPGIQPRLKGKVSDSVKKEAINQIYKALLSFQETVDLSTYRIPYSDEIASELLDQALDKNLYLFNTLANGSDFSKESEFCACYTSGKYIDSFEFQYNVSASSLKKQYQALKEKVKAIKKQLNLEKQSKERIVLAVHDYIALHTDYDTSKKPGRKSYTAYGALLNGKAVCSGYATAGQLLLESYGIPVEITTSDKMDHAWNLVKLSGKWYHMDITWDDPYPEKKNYVTYWFFLKTDKEMRKHSVSKHYSWNSSGIKCTSTRYSKIPLADNKRLFHLNDSWYLAASKKNSSGRYTYKKYNFTFTKSSVLASSTIPFVKYQSRIYYAPRTNRIVSMNINGQAVRKIHTLGSTSRLTSLKIKGNQIRYYYTQKGKKKNGMKKLTSAVKDTGS